MKVESFRPADLPALVRAWNGWFGERRRFRPLTAELLRSKVLRHPDFDPRGLLLAREGRRLAGFVHAGRRKGQGFIAFVWVDPSCRRRDLGTLLWHRALEFARTAGQVLFLNPWENPFYGNPPGEPPLWGTPFGPALDWSDSATLKFLARKGYAPQSRAALLARDLAAAVPRGRPCGA
jgi:GNAT superfamily N-acetyltransferase